jgi:hypothetical protein
MRLRLRCILLAAFIQFGAGGECPADTTIHENPDFCYTIEIPDGWSAESGRASTRRYSVFTWISNTDPPAPPVLRGHVPVDSVRHYDTETRQWVWYHRSRSEDIREAAQRILKPGTVSINLGISSSIDRPAYFTRVPLAVEAGIDQFLRDAMPEYESNELTIFQIYAGQWNCPWTISVYGREPFLREDLEEAFAILRSIRFPSVPVRFDEQAIELVIPQIPRFAFHNSELECVWPGNFQDWRVREEGDGFRVTYTQLDGSEDPRPLRAYRYFVTRKMKAWIRARAASLDPLCPSGCAVVSP